jgi:hypothetical protein
MPGAAEAVEPLDARPKSCWKSYCAAEALRVASRGGGACWCVGCTGERKTAMPYSWEDIKRAIERTEDARLRQELTEREIAEGRVRRGFYLVRRSRLAFQVIGGVVTGIHVAVMVLIFNFLLFVWLLHVNFDF